MCEVPLWRTSGEDQYHPPELVGERCAWCGLHPLELVGERCAWCGLHGVEGRCARGDQDEKFVDVNVLCRA